MATTQNTYTGNGSTTNYSFTFEYLKQADVKVTLDSVATTAFTFANATTIAFTSAPANSVAIRIFRDTAIDTLSSTFFSGSAIKAEDLNQNFTQNLYVTQESETAIGIADTTANTASTNASAAVTTANSANTKSDAAVTTANTASTNASAAVTTANTASTNASAAVTTANTADTNASAAVVTANAASAAVSTVTLFTLAANVAAIPGSPSDNDSVEIGDSTGIESFTPLSGLPSGFTGASGLTVRIRYDNSASSWVFMNYFANDSEDRYFQIAGGTLTGDLTIPDKIIHSGDTNTAVRFPANDTVSVETAGSERLRIDSSGNVGIGTSSPDAKLVILEPVGSSTPAKMKFVNAGDRGVTIGFKDHNASPDFAVSSGDEANDWVVIDVAGNVGIGTDNPQAKLDVNGDASINTLTVGLGGGSISANTAIGKDVLSSNTTGSHNAALGINALFSNTIGVSNTAIGTGALQGNTEGDNNTAVGRQALYTNTIGSINTALGRNALFSNTQGVNNTAVGQSSLQYNTTGDFNTAVGVSALFNNTDGANNTAVGQSALIGNITGRNNIALGRSALFSNTIGLGNIGIGGVNSLGSYTPVFNPTTQSNRIVMGSTSVTNAYVQVAWTVTSDARDKTNFAPVPYGLDFVNQLKPTAYQFKLDRDAEETNGGVRYGFKAQDILALEGDNPVIIDNEDPDHLKYKGEHLVPVLVNAVQELTAIVNDLQAKVQALEVTN